MYLGQREFLFGLCQIGEKVRSLIHIHTYMSYIHTYPLFKHDTVYSSKLVGSCKNDYKWIKLYKNKNNITYKIQLQSKSQIQIFH